MEKIIISIATIILLLSCESNSSKSENLASNANSTVEGLKPDLFYHYSIWYAFVNRVFDGDIDAKILKTKGDIGLGSYNALDGELIMLDGVLYQATQDGKVQIPNDDVKIAYANATFFDVDDVFKLSKVLNYKSLRDSLNVHIPTKNIFYGFKIHGVFKKMKCGGLHKQDKPYDTGLDILIPNRPIFERENFSGTMVGFFCPEYIGNINVAAYHLHFVSDDRKFAGHVMEFEATDLIVEVDYIYEYNFVLPKTDAYLKGSFEKEFQYKKK
jgi:acetolactate decarboxylase